jgi:uncharacterized protein (TIGR03437 family)
VIIYVAGNAANNNNTTTGDRIYTADYRLTPAATGGGNAPTISEVINGAGFQNNIAAGSWVAIKGQNLATNTRTWRADEIVEGKLPTSLDGASATINGKPAAVYYISPTQINVQAPSDEAVGPVPVEVTFNGVKSSAFTAMLQRFSPGFFPLLLNETTYAIATHHPAGNLVAPAGQVPGGAPVRPGEVIVLWGTGFGPTDPPIPAGQAVDRANNVVTPPVIRIGDVAAEYVGGALTFGLAAVYQIAVRVPETVAEGNQKIRAEVGGVQSPDNVFITIQR